MPLYDVYVFPHDLVRRQSRPCLSPFHANLFITQVAFRHVSTVAPPCAFVNDGVAAAVDSVKCKLWETMTAAGWDVGGHPCISPPENHHPSRL